MRAPLDVVAVIGVPSMSSTFVFSKIWQPFPAREEPQQSDQVFPRVKLRLVVEPHCRPVEERRARHELGVEAQFGREVGFLL